MTYKFKQIGLFGLLGLTQTVFAQAALQPGDIERQVEPQRAIALPQVESKPGRISKPSDVVPGASTTQINAWAIEGNTVIETSELLDQLQYFTGVTLSMKQINEAAALIQQMYEDRGWLARIVLPKQDITNGTIKIQIIESRLGQIKVDAASTSLVDPDRVQAMVAAQHSLRDVFNSLQINRGLLLADDLNGVSVVGSLQPGDAEGTTDVLLKTTAEQPSIYEASFDNTNARAVGANRLFVSATRVSPFGTGESFSVQGLKSEGVDYARLGASAPLGNYGLKGTVFVTDMKYKIVTNDEQGRSQDVSGNVQIAGFDLSYPLIRSRDANLYMQGGAEKRKYQGYFSGQVNSHYHVHAAQLGLTGNRFDTFGGAGSNSFNVTFYQGVVTSDSVQVNANVAGQYSKVRWSFSRQQALLNSVSLYAAVQGQNTGNKQLDSSENISIGGVSGVRAYATGEGTGPQGQIANLELRWSVRSEWTITPFVDWGRVEKREQNPRSYNLKGAGVSATWTGQSGWMAKTTYAHRMGSNPNPTTTGNDQDGTLHKHRVWFSLNRTF